MRRWRGLLVMVGAVRAAHSPWVMPFGDEPLRLFDIGGVIATFALAITFVVASARNTRALYLAEPMPVRDDDRRVA